MRLAIAGVPKAGKTTHSKSLTGPIFHTDDLIEGNEWSEASAKAMEWFNQPGPFVVEGVAVPRALRKWLAANPKGKPVDKVIWLDTPHLRLTKGQNVMAKGCYRVMKEIIPELVSRGVEIDLTPLAKCGSGRL